MFQKWYDPVGFSEWAKRAFSFFNLGLLIFSALFLFSEFRFDWCERLLGRYLVATNPTRPETGAAWELGRDTLAAHESLDNMLAQRADTQQAARGADSFAALAKGLGAGEWVTLDKTRFKHLYRALSPANARQILEPARLVWLLNGDVTDRIFCEGLTDAIKIYFINAGNRVVRQVDLKRAILSAIEQKEYLVPGALELFEGFSGRIYTADRFFQAVFSLPEDMLRDLIPDPELLLEQDGTILRVGIWNEAQSGYIRLGFEFRRQGEQRVLFARAREWAVWQLGLALKGEAQ